MCGREGQGDGLWGGAEGRDGERPIVCRYKDLEAGRADEVVGPFVSTRNLGDLKGSVSLTRYFLVAWSDSL